MIEDLYAEYCSVHMHRAMKRVYASVFTRIAHLLLNTPHVHIRVRRAP